MGKRDISATQILGSDGTTNRLSEESLPVQPTVETTAETTSEIYDPFDLKNLRLNPAGMVGCAEKLITSYSVRKPRPNAYFRVHPGEDYYAEAYLYMEKDEAGIVQDTYLVSPAFAPQLDIELASFFKTYKLFLALERHAAKPFIWPIGFPQEGERDNEHWRSAREHSERAKTEWIRIKSEGGAYSVYLPRLKFADPIWTTVPFSNILRLGFKDRVIDSQEHPVIKELIGQV